MLDCTSLQFSFSPVIVAAENYSLEGRLYAELSIKG